MEQPKRTTIPTWRNSSGDTQRDGDPTRPDRFETSAMELTDIHATRVPTYQRRYEPQGVSAETRNDNSPTDQRRTLEREMQFGQLAFQRRGRHVSGGNQDQGVAKPVGAMFQVRVGWMQGRAVQRNQCAVTK